jgi:glycosyltransferase involved in cell wall biosynthesis
VAAARQSMRVLIEQQFHLGHHYQYVGHLLPSLIGTVDEVVVAVTQEGLQSPEFESALAPYAARVRFEPLLPAASPWLPMAERWRVHRALRAAVAAIRPDYVLIPSGDAQATAMGWYRATGRGSLPGAVPCEVGIHFGSAGDATPQQRLRDAINQMNLAFAKLRRVHLINFLFYETLQASRLRSRFTLMPHPVAVNPRLGKADSRRRLGIPEDGRYIGLAGSLDSRKAIPELLSAFRAVSSAPDERVLLAGWMNDTHRRTISESFSDLVRQGKLIVLDGFLSTESYQTALSALDVVCTPYPGFAGLSSTLLEGVAAGRPVLANRSGWMHALVERFRVGWTCDVTEHSAFAASIRTALDEASDYCETEMVRRLLAFHDIRNFAALWGQGISEWLGRPVPRALDWAWVEESMSESRPARS